MKYKITMFAVLSLILSGMMTFTVHAESDEPTEYQYYLKYTRISPSANAYFVYHEYEYTSQKRLCFVITGKDEQYDTVGEQTDVDRIFLLYYGGESNTTLYTIKSKQKTVYAKKDGSVIDIYSANTSEYANPYPFVNSGNASGLGSGYYDLDTNIPIFRHFEAVEHYFLTGETSGAINTPVSNKKHDFTADQFDPSIPVPELSHISYDGFTVTNTMDNEYFIDVVVESNLFGVKIHRGMTVCTAEPDLDWKFSSHYYNLADGGRSGKKIQVDLPKQYGVSPRDDLIEDFKRWSVQYPSVKNLPGYNPLIHPNDKMYKTVHVYGKYPAGNYQNKDEEDTALLMTDRAQISYYVRFRDDSGVCGAWVLYTYRERLSVNQNLVQIGQIEVDQDGNIVVDSDGKPVIKDILTGSQGLDGSDIDFSSGSGFDILDFLGIGKVGEMFDYMKTVFDKAAGSLSSFGSLISACFSFLPQELIGFIVLGIVLMILVGIIKVVKG